MFVLRAESLPEGALEAQQAVLSHYVPKLREALGRGEDAALILPMDTGHNDEWRIALARDLARGAAPARCNIIGGGGETEIAESLTYLKNAPGVTGQYLALSDGA